MQETNHAWAGNTDKIPDSIGVSTFPVDGVVTTSINTGHLLDTGGGGFNLGAGVGQTCSIFRFASQGGGHTASVGVTNRYLVGPYHTITVNKHTTGQVAPNAVFLVVVECDVPLYTGQPSVGGRYPYYMTFGPAFAPSSRSTGRPSSTEASMTARSGRSTLTGRCR